MKPDKLKQEVLRLVKTTGMTVIIVSWTAGSCPEFTLRANDSLQSSVKIFIHEPLFSLFEECIAYQIVTSPEEITAAYFHFDHTFQWDSPAGISYLEGLIETLNSTNSTGLSFYSKATKTSVILGVV